MKILVIYFKWYEKRSRNTIDEHLYSFEKYSGAECYYLNAAGIIPRFINTLHFDLVVYHYTFLACKWDINYFLQMCETKWASLKQLQGYKVALPQDEYVNSIYISRFFKEFGIRTVFTCLDEVDWEKVYPVAESGLQHYVKVFTGYINEEMIKTLPVLPVGDRSVDIGYRARKNPYWLGRHATIKWQIAELFVRREAVERFKVDISTRQEDVLLGDDWYAFLARCRVVIGCEGGASLHDPAGEIRKKVDAYVVEHPDADFDEVEQACFPGMDGNLQLFALSPRHFECCITKTCQVLVEGKYSGVFKPGIHYIELKEDFSNFSEVLDQIADKDYCAAIADNAYRDIVGSGCCTYRAFVQKILAFVGTVGVVASPAEGQDDSLRYQALRRYEQINKVVIMKDYVKVRLCSFAITILKSFGLYDLARKLLGRRPVV